MILLKIIPQKLAIISYYQSKNWTFLPQ